MKSFGLLSYYRLFSRYAGKRLHVLIWVVAIGGVLESVGIGLFIPLLSLGDVASEQQNAISGFFREALATMGVGYTLNNVLFVILAVFLVKGVVSMGQAALAGHIMATLTYDLRRRLVTLLSKTSYQNFTRLHTGYLTNVVTTEADRAVACFGHYTNAVVSVMHASAYVALALLIDFRGTLLFLVLGVLALGSLSGLHRLSRRYSRLTSERNANLHDLLIQTIQAFKYLRATDSFGALIGRVTEELRELSRYVFRLSVLTATLKSVGEPIGVLILVIVLFVNVSFLGHPLADMLFLSLIIYRLMSKLLGVQTHWQKFNGTAGGLEAYESAFSRLEEDEEPQGGELVTGFADRISFRDVSFSYDDRRVLENINIEVPKHKMVGIVGKTGAGKSTVVNLLTGVLEPEKGDVLIDGRDYRSLEKSSLRRFIGYVTQENVIFRDTIANNVSLWKSLEGGGADFEQVKSALREVHAEEFVEGTEDGYNTVLGDRGFRVSGGQRQQIALAREVYKDPEIVILDEAMSSLDAKSEWLIQKRITDWRGDRTIVVVTHRLTSVKDCDYVYVLAEGRIIEEGTYEELYRKTDSSFAELAQLQGL